MSGRLSLLGTTQIKKEKHPSSQGHYVERWKGVWGSGPALSSSEGGVGDY